MDAADLAGRRIDYDAATLADAVPNDPLDLFKLWLDDAIAAQDSGLPLEATAMNLATLAQRPDGSWLPRVRTVLLKGWDEQGFCFFTNYDSDKGRELEANPNVCLHFHWHALQRQIRIEGVAERVSRARSEDYFSSRPRKSALAAWASEQSRPVASREELEERFRSVEERFSDTEQIACPPNWGGYRVRPERFEFWQGRRSRLHDRIVFVRTGEAWETTRLQP